MNGFLRDERGGVVRWIILIIVIAAGIYGYQYFKKTPRYALIQFKKAILMSNTETAQKFMDFDKVIARLPEDVTKGVSAEVYRERLIKEVGSPSEKSFFAPVKSWSVIKLSITTSADEIHASAEPAENTSVNLQKTAEGHWTIIAIETR